MYNPKLSIVLPTYNEVDNVQPMVEAIRVALDRAGVPFEVIFVDDSNDDTPERVRTLQAEDSRIQLIHRIGADRQGGLATAFIAGLESAHARYVACMDADLQHPPELLPAMVHVLESEKATFVVGSRFTNGGADRGFFELHRKIVTKSFQLLTWSLLPATRKTTDPMSGFFMFDKRFVRSTTKLRPQGFKIMMELIVRVRAFTVVELPVRMRDRVAGETKSGAKQAFTFFGHVLRLLMSVRDMRNRLVVNALGSTALAISVGVILLVQAWHPLWAMLLVLLLVPIITGCVLLCSTILFILERAVRRVWAKQQPFVRHLRQVRPRFAKHALGVVRRVRAPGSRLHTYVPQVRKVLSMRTTAFLVAGVVLAISVAQLYGLSQGVLADLVLTVALIQILQGGFALYVLVYAWEDPKRMIRNRSPQVFKSPQYSFTALLPARHEADVIGDTIRSIARIAYPEDKKELLVVLRDDDPETIQAAEQALQGLPEHNARIVLITGEPQNKPHHLNDGLAVATGDVVCIFDAEDEPHTDIYSVVDTVYQERGCDVVQSGVQLMNYDTNWYSLFNVLEYYLWFRSALHFFASHSIIPLGGNTVFFKRQWLNKVGGWDLNCLTEDADIGIRLSVAGAKTEVIYDSVHATREETPPTLMSFIKQRTRWNLGFLQIIRKYTWLHGNPLPLKQRALALFILGWPVLYSFLLLALPLVFLVALFLDVHPLVSIVTNLPTLILISFLLLQVVALYDFTRVYGLPFRVRHVVTALVFYIPYLILLEVSALRAVYRYFRQETAWEKTEHVNAHRQSSAVVVEPEAATAKEEQKEVKEKESYQPRATAVPATS